MRISRRTLGTALAGVVALAIATPAVAQKASQALSSESVIETIKKRGVIKIGLSLFVPWSMRDKSGELIGFELDVGRQARRGHGCRSPNSSPRPGTGSSPALVAGKFDAIISGMSVTAQRNLTINFTNPYAYSGLTVLANRQMTEGFTLEDFNSEDVTFAARRGATPAVLIPELFPKAQMLQFDEDRAAAQEVLNGNAHATMAAQPTPNREANNYPDTLYVPFDKLWDPRGEASPFARVIPTRSTTSTTGSLIHGGQAGCRNATTTGSRARTGWTR